MFPALALPCSRFPLHRTRSTIGYRVVKSRRCSHFQRSLLLSKQKSKRLDFSLLQKRVPCLFSNPFCTRSSMLFSLAKELQYYKLRTKYYISAFLSTTKFGKVKFIIRHIYPITPMSPCICICLTFTLLTRYDLSDIIKI